LSKVRTKFALNQAILFGSRARGDDHEGSDTDIAVILDGPPQSLIDTKLDLSDLAYEVLLETGVYIQPLPIWQGQWSGDEPFSNPALLDNIRREGRLI